MPVFVTSVSGGNCMTLAPNGLLNKKAAKGDKNQSWIVEREGDSSTITLKCVANNQYLHADSGNSYAPCKTGAKQLWQMEPGTAPASFWLKCTSYPNAYLCNANGSHAENNKIYCWPKQANWTHALTWYLQDVSDTDPLGRLQEGSQEAVSNEKMKEREEALAEREAELKAFEESLTKQDTELHVRQQVLKQREEKVNQENKQRASNKDETEKADGQLREENRRLAAELAKAQAAQADGSLKERGEGFGQGEENLKRENRMLAAELARIEHEVEQRRRGQTTSRGSIVIPPLRKLPPIIRPAQHLPKGFDRRLAKPAGSIR